MAGADALLTPRLPGVAFAGLALALFASILVHLPALDTFFAQDDFLFLARVRGIEETPWVWARPLSMQWRWEAMHALFGLDPRPWHVASLLVHLASVWLVWAIARRLTGGAMAAAAAATVFGVSAIAFTPLHWLSAFGDLLVTTCLLCSLWAYLRTHGRHAWAWAGVSGIAFAGALLAKETAVLFPLVLLVVEWRQGAAAARARAVIPGVVIALVVGAAWVARSAAVNPIAAGAYASDYAPGFLATNLATYLRWLVSPHVPVRDAHAAADPAALATGAIVAALAVGLLWVQRRDRSHPAEVGAVWFLALLLPVLPFANRSYLYYMYPALPGACLFMAAAGGRAGRRMPGRVAAVAAGVAVIALAGLDGWSVRAREQTMTGDFHADRTIRESVLLRNAVADLDSAALSPGTRVAFINPAPPRHTALAPGPATHGYVPLERVLGGQRAFEIFFPDLVYLGFADSLPRAWEDAEVFFYFNDGDLERFGRGAHALAEIGSFGIRQRQFEMADKALRRSLALDSLPDAVFGLFVTSDALGRPAEARRHAETFARRWPRDERAVWLHQTGWVEER